MVTEEVSKQKLSHLRKFKGLSQADLARHVKCSTTTIYRIENGYNKTCPSYRVMEGVSKYFNLEIKDIDEFYQSITRN